MSDNKIKDEQFITNLKADESYKNIKAGFEWNNIPSFAVITGENGSGKTALLEQINFLSKDKAQRSIFTNFINSRIQYYDNITLQYEHYAYDGSIVRPIKEAIEKTHTNFHHLNDYIKKNYNKQITIKDFLEENLTFNQTIQEHIKAYRAQSISYFDDFKEFLKRHGKTIKDLVVMDKHEAEQWLDSLTDINVRSVPAIFNQKLLLAIFGRYFIRYDNCKKELERRYPQKSAIEIKKEVEKEIGENPLDKINTILQQYYPKYEVEVSRDESDKIHLICRDRQNKILLNQLSLGEQIIISLILWQHENTSLDSVVLLLDEPDAHLNPKMAKMLIDILKNIVVEKFNCQVIMTTHSLSSVAYCKEGDLFFMEEGEIRKIKKKDAIEKLSDGVMTFNHAMNVIEQIQQSEKILMVEGKIDKLHIENFYQLKNEEPPFKIIVCDGVVNMKHFNFVFKYFNVSREKILFLCDYDEMGVKIYEKIEYAKIYTLDIETLPEDDDRIRAKNYPIEMLYPLEILINNDLVEKIKAKDFDSILDETSQREIDKNLEVTQYKENYKIKSNANKTKFADEVIKTLDIKDFEEFEGLATRIEKEFDKISNSNSSN